MSGPLTGPAQYVVAGQDPGQDPEDDQWHVQSAAGPVRRQWGEHHDGHDEDERPSLRHKVHFP